MLDERYRTIVEARTRRPEAIAEAAARRARPRSLFNEHGRLMMIAADHPARGALRAGDRALAMADRLELLDRICLARDGFEGGKMLLRIDPDDPSTVATVEACGRAVSELASRRLLAMVEPFISHRVDGRVRIDLGAEASIRAMTVAAGIRNTSAHTWPKVPGVEDMERVMAATTLPALLLGGEVSSAQDAAFESWRKALKLPTVQGLVIGRSLLYPPDDDVAAAVDTAVGLMQEGTG